MHRAEPVVLPNIEPGEEMGGEGLQDLRAVEIPGALLQKRCSSGLFAGLLARHIVRDADPERRDQPARDLG